MKVLVGCEYSGVVRRAFAARGHDVWSCDLLPAEDGSNRHIIGDVREIMHDGWDLGIFHPPCTRLCNSGVRWLIEPPKKIAAEHYTAEEIAAYAKMDRDQRLAFMWLKLEEGCELFSACLNAPIDRVAVENPVMHKHAKARIKNYQPAAQTVQPWWFGDRAFKGTGFYLRGLKKLVATNRLVPPKRGTPEHKEWSAVHLASPGRARWRLRSRTFPGVAAAFADQWGSQADVALALAAE